MLIRTNPFDRLLFEGNNDNPPPGDPPPKDPPADPPPADPPPVDPPPPKQSVSIDEHNKALAALEKERNKNKILDDSVKANELRTLKDNERWKEVAEVQEREKNDAVEKLDRQNKAIIDDKKYTSVREAALRAGIKKEALDDLEMIEFPEVQVETTASGGINIVGAQTAVESLKLKRPHWFGKKSVSLNNDLPEVVEGGKVTVDQVMAAESKWRKTQADADYAVYTKLNVQLKQQR